MTNQALRPRRCFGVFLHNVFTYGYYLLTPTTLEFVWLLKDTGCWLVETLFVCPISVSLVVLFNA